MKIKTQLHTIFLMVGPSNTGKTVLSRRISDEINKTGLRCSVISSDQIRTSLLGNENIDKYDTKMLEVSQQAFNILHTLLQSYTSWPVNNEFIVIDTTGMNEDFRNTIIDLARNTHYNVDVCAFDYRWDEYLEDITDSSTKQLISSQVRRFKEKVMPTISRKKYTNVNVIRKRDHAMYSDLEIEITNIDLWKRCMLTINEDETISFIGDIHEAVEPLQELISKLPDNATLVMVGDLVDKGNQPKELVEYISNLQKERKVIIIKGNHDDHIYRRLMNTKTIDPEIEEKYYPSSSFFLNPDNVDTASKFIEICNNMVPFVIVQGKDHRRTMYVTHSPCNVSVLGKLDEKSLKQQMTMHIGRTEEEVSTWITDYKSSAVGNMPYRISGHIPHCSSTIEYKNIVLLDTGGVYGTIGGKLSAMSVTDTGRVWVTQVPGLITENCADQALFPLLDTKRDLNKSSGLAPVSSYKLEPEDMRRLNRLLREDVKYISGTMAPAPSTDSELESLTAGLNKFIKSGCTSVSIQPKFMGSRSNVYLFRDPEIECYATTRNGFRITWVPELNDLLSELRERFLALDTWKSSIILDGELLPWSILGERLINEQFIEYGLCVEREYTTLLNDPIFMNFDSSISKDPQHKLTQLESFNDQLRLYGAKNPIEYRPFSILAIDDQCVYHTNSQHDTFNMLNEFIGSSDIHSILLDLNDPEYLTKAESFFNQCVIERHMEGIVIKPDVFQPGFIPYMKVRNENYLTLVYGFDYKDRYDKLAAKKRIDRKLKVSINEFNLGLTMLDTADKGVLEQVYCAMLYEVSKERELDPRL